MTIATKSRGVNKSANAKPKKSQPDDAWDKQIERDLDAGKFDTMTLPNWKNMLTTGARKPVASRAMTRGIFKWRGMQNWVNWMHWAKRHGRNMKRASRCPCLNETSRE